MTGAVAHVEVPARFPVLEGWWIEGIETTAFGGRLSLQIRAIDPSRQVTAAMLAQRDEERLESPADAVTELTMNGTQVLARRARWNGSPAGAAEGLRIYYVTRGLAHVASVLTDAADTAHATRVARTTLETPPSQLRAEIAEPPLRGTLAALVTPLGWELSAVDLVGGEAALRVVVHGDESASPELLAARHGRELSARLAGYQESSSERRAAAGGEFILSRWSCAGGTGISLYGLQHGRARAAILTGGQAVADRQLDRAIELLGGLRFESARPAREYSGDELVALAELMGDVSALDAEERVPLDPPGRLAARRALIARRAIRAATNGRLSIHESDRTLIAAALSSPVTVRVEHRGVSGRERQRVYVTPSVLVRHDVTPSGIHRFSARSATGAPQLTEVTELPERPCVASPALKVPRSVFSDLRAAAEQGSLAAAHARGDGEALRQLLVTAVSSSHVRVNRRVVGSPGGELVWLDAGAAGLWAIESEPDVVALTPVTAAELRARFTRLWADAEGSRAPAGR